MFRRQPYFIPNAVDDVRPVQPNEFIKTSEIVCFSTGLDGLEHVTPKRALLIGGDPFFFTRGCGEGRMQQWICGARLPIGTSQKVGHTHLMGEDQMRDDVARKGAIAVGVEQAFDRCTLTTSRAAAARLPFQSSRGEVDDLRR